MRRPESSSGSTQVYPKGTGWWDIPSPLAIGDGRIFFTAGYGRGAVMLKLER